MIKSGTKGLFSDWNKTTFLVNILSHFSINRKQTVLNVQTSSLTNVHVGSLQGSIYSTFIINLTLYKWFIRYLTSNAKHVADDTWLFSVVHDVNTSVKELTDDLKKVNDQGFQWKTSFSANQSKQAQKVMFSLKLKRPIHPQLVFNNNVSQTFFQKNLVVILDF